MDAPSDLIQSVSRALRILEVVGQHPQGIAPKAIARRTGLKLATTYHLLRTLAYEDYLVRGTDGDYTLGLTIADRFADLRTVLDGPAAATAVLRQLSRGIGHSVYLARFVDGRITITTTIEGPGSPHLEDLIPGFDEGAHATALGKALLSRLPRQARHAYLAERGLRPFTPRTVVDVADLDGELDARTDGVFVEEEQFSGAVSCVARLVDHGGSGTPEGRWWAIGVATSSQAFHARRAELVGALRTAATDLAA